MTLRNPGNLQVLLRTDNRALQLAMAGMAAMLRPRPGQPGAGGGARPILMLEDPESRLHPHHAGPWPGGCWSSCSARSCSPPPKPALPLPLNQVRRLVRRQQDILCHQLGGERYSSDDLRKIAFHVRINRPMSMFARCWLLVEGED